MRPAMSVRLIAAFVMFVLSLAPAASQTGPTDEDKNALLSAYGGFFYLERCAAFGAAGQPISALRATMAQIEKSATAMKMETAAARQQAREKLKSELEMLDSFVAMRGTMNYAQRDSIGQFCSLFAGLLQSAARHFREADRSAGR